MYRTHTVSIGINVAPDLVYAFASDPANMPAWAPGFVASIRKNGDHWIAETSLGPAKIRFAPANPFGVIDHDVELPGGTFHNPVRVVPNGPGSEVLFTSTQWPGISDEQFAADLETVSADLYTLRSVLERRHGAG